MEEERGDISSSQLVVHLFKICLKHTCIILSPHLSIVVPKPSCLDLNTAQAFHNAHLKILSSYQEP